MRCGWIYIRTGIRLGGGWLRFNMRQKGRLKSVQGQERQLWQERTGKDRASKKADETAILPAFGI